MVWQSVLLAELSEGNKAGMFVYVNTFTHPRLMPLVVIHNTNKIQCTRQFKIMFHLRNTKI